MKALIISSVILLLTAQQVWAQEVMTLKQCVEYAVQNSANVQVSQEQNKQQSTYKRDAWLNAFTPRVSATAQIQFSTGRQADLETNMWKDQKTENDNYSLNAEITLFDGFNNLNNIKRAKNLQLSSEESLKEKKEEISLNTIQYFYNLLYYTKMTDIAQKQMTDAENSLTKVRREFELGTKSARDVLDKESAQAEAELTYTKYNAQKSNALLQLKTAMFYPQDQNLAINTTINENIDLYTQSDVAQTASYAAENNSQSLIKKYNMENRLKELNTERWRFLPSINAFAGWNTTHGVDLDNRDAAPSFSEQFKNRAGKWVGISARIDLYNRLGKFSRVSRAKSEYKIATYEYEIKQREIEDEVYGAYNELEQQAKQLEASRKAAELNQKYFDLAQKRFELGLVNYIEYDQAYNKYLESQANYYNALFNYRIKAAVVNYYKGESFSQQL